jgi:hypothetical protein
MPEVVDELLLGTTTGLEIKVLLVEKLVLTLACRSTRESKSKLSVELDEFERDQIGVRGAELVLSLGLSKSSNAGGSWILSTSKESRMGVRDGSADMVLEGVINLPGAVRRLLLSRREGFFLGTDKCDEGCSDTTISGRISALSSDGVIARESTVVWLSPLP